MLFFGLTPSQSIDDVYWTEDAADEDMMNTYCWMYGHLNLPYDYMVGAHWNR